MGSCLPDVGKPDHSTLQRSQHIKGLSTSPGDLRASNPAEQTQDFSRKLKVPNMKSPSSQSYPTEHDKIPYQKSTPKFSKQNPRVADRQEGLTQLQVQVKAALTNDREVQQEIDLGLQAQQLQRFDWAGQLYRKALQKLDSGALGSQYSPESIEDAKLFIHHKLIEVELANDDTRKVQSHFQECFKLYDAKPDYKIIQEKISLLNNYAVFLREHDQHQKAIDVCKKTLALQQSYYTRGDIRKYHTLINLAVLLQENQQLKEAEDIYRELAQCKDSRIRKQAAANRSSRSHTYQKQ